MDTLLCIYLIVKGFIIRFQSYIKELEIIFEARVLGLNVGENWFESSLSDNTLAIPIFCSSFRIV